ncbi:MAG TPA: adenylate/guanylate cyclase domain-containing protein [Actinomycetota bacterium]|nr:adenylate/guanylate cyclase domain-containing protein [Actinomycetota bacterium]
MLTCPNCGASNPEAARFCNACGVRLHTAEEREGERRVVTMLFCDVRGSTAMAETLDAEEWTDIMNLAYERLIEPVIRHEGTVARLMGDAILAFFGAPKAHEDDPQRAVMAGLEIVSAIGPLRERLERERGLDLDVRVGINTGPVVVGQVGSTLRQEYTALGDAVNVAARMEQTAEPGTVQITEDTYRLVADLFDVEGLGGIELKGKREPVSAYRVRGRLDAPWRVRASRSLEGSLVGREAEMDLVRRALERTGEGEGSVILLVGEPGIGKSRLVEEANALWAELEPADERRWDFWYCVPFDALQPYAQYRRLIRERAGIIETDPTHVIRSKIAEAMARVAVEGWRERSERVARALLGVEQEDDEHLEGEAFQHEATELVVGSTLAQPGRRLVVFEDLHWCDQASLDLVRATVALARDHPYVFIATFRPDPSAPSQPFREWVEDELTDRTIAIELAPLTGSESERLIGELLPVAMPNDLRRRILDKTEGNPLFVQEVVRSLIDGGAVERAGAGLRLAASAGEVAIPGSVQSLITAGLDRLPEPTRRTLQTAAVIGRTFEADVLRTAIGDGDLTEHLLEHLLELERRDLIRAADGSTSPTYTFRHALTQEAAYGSLLTRTRRSIHLRLAHGLETASADRLETVAPVLAHHFREAGEDGAALRYALLAGDAAARLYANADAEAHYRAALDLALRTDAESAMLRSTFEKRGSALELAGRHHEAVANYEEMRSVARGRGNEAMELAANGAIAILYATPSPLFDLERGRELSEANAVTARRLGDRTAEARALWNVVVANIYGGGDERRAVEAGEASLAIARELGEREQIAFTLNDVSRAHMAIGDFGTAAERLAEARLLWEALDNRPMLADNLTLLSLLRLMAGDHDGAMAEAERAVEISREIGNRWGESVALMWVYRVQLVRGELGAAMREIERCREVGEEGGFAFAGVGTRADLALLRATLGDGAGALMLAREADAIARVKMPSAISVAAVGEAAALVELGDHGGARRALDLVDVSQLPVSFRTFTLTSAGLVRSRAAMATEAYEDAAAAVDGVLQHLRGNGIEILVADALVTLARIRLAQGRVDEAEHALAQAEERAARLGELLALWQALALRAVIIEARGDKVGAAETRDRARAIVERVASGIDDENLRGSFLGLPEVRGLHA